MARLRLVADNPPELVAAARSFHEELDCYREQRVQSDPWPITTMNARPLPVDFIDGDELVRRLAAIEADQERDFRARRWKRRIGIACYLLAVFCACYFAAEFVR